MFLSWAEKWKLSKCKFGFNFPSVVSERATRLKIVDYLNKLGRECLCNVIFLNKLGMCKINSTIVFEFNTRNFYIHANIWKWSLAVIARLRMFVKFCAFSANWGTEIAKISNKLCFLDLLENWQCLRKKSASL